MPGILLLTTDTLHHRYFINRFAAAGISFCGIAVETSHAVAPFPTGPLFEDEQDRFEVDRWRDQLQVDTTVFESVINFNDDRMAAIVERLKPDLGLVFGAGLLRPTLINRFPHGLFNVHRGLADRYRGLDSDLWAIYHRDWSGLGVTIHKVAPELDTGDVLSRRVLELRKGMLIHELRAHTTEMAVQMMLDVVRAYLTGKLASQPATKLGRYYSFMPLELKQLMQSRFNAHCQALHA